MPRNPSGDYTLPLAPVVTDTPIATTWANPTMDDLAQSMTDSLSRSGKGGMTAVMKLVDTSVGNIPASPALQFNSESNSGIYRAAQFDIRHSLASEDMLRLYQDGIGDRFFQFWDGTAFQDIIYNGGPANILANNTFLQGTDFAGTGVVDIVKVNASDEIEFGAAPSIFGGDTNVIRSEDAAIKAKVTNSNAGVAAQALFVAENDAANNITVGMLSTGFTPIGGFLANYGYIATSPTTTGLNILVRGGQLDIYTGGLTDIGLSVDATQNVIIPNGNLTVSVGTIAIANTGDAYVQYTVTAATNWCAGIDDSDGDAWVVCRAAAPDGTNALHIGQSNNVTIPNGILRVDGTGVVTHSAEIFNGTATALFLGTNSGQSQLRVGSAGNTAVFWELGRDNSVTGDFIISNVATEAFRISATNNVSIPNGNLLVTGTLSGTTFTSTGLGGRSSFHANDETFVLGLKFSAAGTIAYIGADVAGNMQISNAGGSALAFFNQAGPVIISSESALLGWANASYNDFIVGGTTGARGMTIAGGTTSRIGIAFSKGNGASIQKRGYIDYSNNLDRMYIGAADSDAIEINGALNVEILTGELTVAKGITLGQGLFNISRNGATGILEFVGSQVGFSGYRFVGDASTIQLDIAASTGTVTIPSLAGAGSRTVVADANGVLSAP